MFTGPIKENATAAFENNKIVASTKPQPVLVMSTTENIISTQTLDVVNQVTTTTNANLQGTTVHTKPSQETYSDLPNLLQEKVPITSTAKSSDVSKLTQSTDVIRNAHTGSTLEVSHSSVPTSTFSWSELYDDTFTLPSTTVNSNQSPMSISTSPRINDVTSFRPLAPFVKATSSHSPSQVPVTMPPIIPGNELSNLHLEHGQSSTQTAGVDVPLKENYSTSSVTELPLIVARTMKAEDTLPLVVSAKTPYMDNSKWISTEQLDSSTWQDGAISKSQNSHRQSSNGNVKDTMTNRHLSQLEATQLFDPSKTPIHSPTGASVGSVNTLAANTSAESMPSEKVVESLMVGGVMRLPFRTNSNFKFLFSSDSKSSQNARPNVVVRRPN